MVYWTLFIVTLSSSSIDLEVDYTKIGRYDDRYACEEAYVKLMEIYEGDGAVVCDKTDQ